MRIRIRKGLDLPITGAPKQEIDTGRPVGSVALVANDYQGLAVKLMVEVGDRVRLGQPLFCDKHHPDTLFTSPGCGTVSEIKRGARRAVQAVVVELEGNDEQIFEPCDRTNLTKLDREAVQELLLASGLWTRLRTRPFSRVPEPRTSPHSIFVTAIDTNPLAADPEVVVRECAQDFGDGVAVLSRLTDGEVYVCQQAGTAFDLPSVESVTPAIFEGPHPAGLPGTHIHFIDPVGTTKTVWHINYQDVITIGRLLTTGRISTERVVALGGPAVKRPRLLRTRFGANTVDLLDGELEEMECRIISGSVLNGRRAAGWARYLGPYHLQISVLPEDHHRKLFGWLAPGFNEYSAINAFTSALRWHHEFPMTTSQHGRPRAMVPIGNFEKVMPLDILPAPLLKAVLVRDTQSARELGCLELDEEDLALCSFVCCSKYEYGPALRDNLDIIEREG